MNGGVSPWLAPRLHFMPSQTTLQFPGSAAPASPGGCLEECRVQLGQGRAAQLHVGLLPWHSSFFFEATIFENEGLILFPLVFSKPGKPLN